MRRGLKLAACYLLAAALACGYALLRQSAPPTQSAPEPAASAAYEMLYQRDVAAFETMTVALPQGGYTVLSSMAYDENGQLMGVYNSLGQPVVVKGQEDFALSQTAFQMMLLCAQNLPYTARYEALDPDACGLTAPSARITITYAREEPLELTVGKLTASGGSCYVRVAGDEAIYLVPSDFYAVMTRPLSEQHRLPGALAENVSTAAQAAVIRGGETVIATRRGSGEALFQWQIDQPVSHDGNTAQIEALVSGIAALRADAYAGTVRDARELSDYGLDQPIRLLASFTDGVIRDIALGADAGEGMVYARMDATGDVYLISREQLAFLDAATLDNLTDRFVLLLPSNTLSDVRVATPQREISLHLYWDDPQASLASRYSLGTEEISQEVFSKLYAGLIGLQFDKAAPRDAQTGDELASVTFHLLDGGEQTVRYFDYDRHYLLAQTQGLGNCLVRRERVLQALGALWEEIDHET